jgi:hypothetical protein
MANLGLEFLSRIEHLIVQHALHRRDARQPLLYTASAAADPHNHPVVQHITISRTCQHLHGMPRNVKVHTVVRRIKTQNARKDKKDQRT